MKLTFFGGANSVTGSNYLLETPNEESGTTRVLIDCGLYQGGNFAERQNFEPFPYDPKQIDAVFVTHSHIDHIGLIPKLVRNGFRGRIYSTPPTRDFAELIKIAKNRVFEKFRVRLKEEITRVGKF